MPLGCELLEESAARLFATHLIAQTLHGAVVGEALAQGLDGLTGLQGKHEQLALQVLLGDLDIFARGDAIQDERCFDLTDGLIPLCFAKAREVELTHGFGGHALLRQGAQAAFQASIDLLLHKGLRNRELELLHKVFQHLVAGLCFERILLAGLHPFPQSCQDS